MHPTLPPRARLRLNRETIRQLATSPGSDAFVLASVEICVHSQVRTECLPTTQ